MALLSTEELLSLSGWREREAQQYSQSVATKIVYGKLFLRTPRLCVLLLRLCFLLETRLF